MSKERHNSREAKKKPAMTLSEKRAVKRSKKEDQKRSTFPSGNGR